MKDNEELWVGFIKRDIPKWEEYDIPENPESWYQVYCNLRERVQREVDKDAEQLKQAMEGINSRRAQHSTKLVTDQRLPPMKPTERARYAAYDRKKGGITPVFASSPSSSSSGISADPMGGPAWSFERPQIPRSFSGDGKKKSSIFSAPKRNKALAVPTGQLHNRASQVRMAPRSLVEAHRQPSEPLAARKATPTAKSHPALRAPGRTRSQPAFGSNNPVIMPSLQEREARLRALTSGKPVSSSASRTPAQTSTPATGGSSPPLPAKRKVDDLFEASPGPGSQDDTQEPKRKALKPASLEPTSDTSQFRTPPAQAPRIATIRKRPAPSIFMPPKKKKVT